jgi:hypothetical protein
MRTFLVNGIYIFDEEMMIELGWTKEKLDEIEEALTTGPPEPIFLTLNNSKIFSKSVFEELEDDTTQKKESTKSSDSTKND